MPGNPLGDTRERELTRLLHDLGWQAMRAPASGSSTDRELPDVLAGKDGHFIAEELKASSSDDKVYFTQEEVEALVYFAEQFGATPLLGARFSVTRGDPSWGVDGREGFYHFTPDTVYRTDSGNYRIKKSTALEEGAVTQEVSGLTYE